jgi:hypothetical protein
MNSKPGEIENPKLKKLLNDNQLPKYINIFAFEFL